jgi:hypothetical protein
MRIVAQWPATAGACVHATMAAGLTAVSMSYALDVLCYHLIKAFRDAILHN